MPLKESQPSTQDLGSVNRRLPSSTANFRWPGVERLCMRRSGPKSWLKYISGSISRSRSAAPMASVQPCSTSGLNTPATSLNATDGLSPAFAPAQRKICFLPPLSAFALPSCNTSDHRSQVLANAGRFQERLDFSMRAGRHHAQLVLPGECAKELRHAFRERCVGGHALAEPLLLQRILLPKLRRVGRRVRQLGEDLDHAAIHRAHAVGRIDLPGHGHAQRRQHFPPAVAMYRLAVYQDAVEIEKNGLKLRHGADLQFNELALARHRAS